MPLPFRRKQWEIPITAVDEPRDFDGHKAVVERVLADMSEEERDIVANARFTKVKITGKPLGDAIARWNALDRTVTLSTSDAKDLSQLPVFMHPFANHFAFQAAHELHHPLFYEVRPAKLHNDPDFATARAAAVGHINADSVIKAKVDQVLLGINQFFDSGMPDHFLPIDFGWKQVDPGNREQLGVMIGVLLSNEYHKVYGYTADAAKGRLNDKRCEEMLCNIRALSQVYGEDKVREFAPELVEFARSLTENRGKAEEAPPGMSVLERLKWNRRHSGSGDGDSNTGRSM